MKSPFCSLAADRPQPAAAIRNRPAPARSLDELKRDGAALMSLRGVERAGLHTPCVDCGDRTGHSIGPSADGIWLYKCHKCGAAGSVVDAERAAGGGTVADAIKRLGVDAQATPRSRITAPPAPRREPMQPTCDAQKVYAIFAPAFANVIEGRADDRLKARGITRETIQRPNQHIGWLDSLFVPAWRRTVERVWLILVSTPSGYLGLKIHKEKPCEDPKCLWLPVGTAPNDKPLHCAQTFWPPIQQFDPGETLYLTEGELKAAGALSLGLKATSHTGGSTHQFSPNEIECFRGRRVCLLFDDDDAGRKFRDKCRASLSSVTSKFMCATHGAKPNDQ